jgi:hypothetical protein
MPAAEVLAVPTTVPAASLATPASLRADSEPAELIALDPRRRQKFKLASKEVRGRRRQANFAQLMRPEFASLHRSVELCVGHYEAQEVDWDEPQYACLCTSRVTAASPTNIAPFVKGVCRCPPLPGWPSLSANFSCLNGI